MARERHLAMIEHFESHRRENAARRGEAAKEAARLATERKHTIAEDFREQERLARPSKDVEEKKQELEATVMRLKVAASVSDELKRRDAEEKKMAEDERKRQEKQERDAKLNKLRARVSGLKNARNKK